MLALIPMTKDEFPTFFETVAESHANDNIVAGRWNSTIALALAKDEIKRLLPGNEITPKNYLFVLQDTDLQCSLGYLWYGCITQASQKIAFLYQLYIHPQFRRQGYGRQAMIAFENEALDRGFTTLALHVFATNGAAYRLYQSDGFSASSITMRKEIGQIDV